MGRHRAYFLYRWRSSLGTILLVLALGGGVIRGHAQSSGKLLEQAKAYLAAAHYTDALNTLTRSRRLTTKDEEGRFLQAVCHYQLNNLTEATAILESLINEEKSPYPECWLYLGRILHAQQQFDLAVDNYKLYLRTLRPEHPNRAMVIEDIRRCDNGRRQLYREPLAVVENLGANVNTPADEFGPVLSPNRSTQLYFSSSRPGNTGGLRNAQTQPDEQYGQPFSDMFSTQVAGGVWQAPQPLHYLLNTPQHEQVLGFSDQGQVLLYYRSWNWESGEIFADTFQQATQRSLTTTPYLGPAQAAAGEFHLHLLGDTLLTFAAQRPDGYGGLDLYQSRLRKGAWSPAVNLGPTVNSAYDETTPFLARDGKTLYYSTNDSRRSVGGLDVVRSVFLPDADRWSEAQSLGFPINSAADDDHFRLARDGFTGFFSSARKDGYGQRDLYVAFFTKYRQEMEIPPNATVSTPDPSPPQIIPKPAPPPMSAPAPATETWSVQLDELDQIHQQPPVQQLLRKIAALPTEGVRVLTLYVPGRGNDTKTAHLFRGLEQLQAAVPLLQTAGLPDAQVYSRALTHDQPHYTLVASVAPPNGQAAAASPVIGQTATLYQAKAPANQALTYRVQVSAVQRPLTDEQLSAEQDLMLEKAADSPYYRYTVGSTTTYGLAQELQNRLLAADRRGAYIVAYVHGRRLSKGQAGAYRAAFPDLARYLGQ